MKLAVFVSGRGSNLRAILNSPDLKGLVSVAAVISDKLDCGAFEAVKEHAIDCFSVSAIGKPGYMSFNDIAEKLEELEIDLIVLAGFLKLIPADFVSRFKNKIINIHPALLPAFGGSGMYGMNVHRAVYASSAKVSGPSVHFVDEIYDNGKIIAQQCVDISDVETPEEIAERVLKVEHQLLPFVIKKIAEGKVVLQDNRVLIKN